MGTPVPGSGSTGLAARIAGGIVWLIVWRITTRALGLASTLILVHLLTPADFGLVALALSVTQAVELLSMLGVEDAVIRHHNPDRDIYDTAFTLNAIRGLGTSVMIGAAAAPMASFFNEPRLLTIALVLAVSTLLGTNENIGIVDFRRNMTYDREFKLRIAPRLLSIACTIMVAILFRTYWALVVGILTNRIAGIVMSYTFHPYRPRFTLAAWRELTGFSLWVWVTALVAMARDRVELTVIGRLMGTAPVGMFVIAVEVAILPLTELMQPLTRVLFSAFSRTIHDDQETTNLFLRFIGLSAIITIPAGAGIALLADPLTHVVLGPAWLAAVPLIQVVAVCSALTTFGFISRALLEARKQMSASFYVTVLVTGLRLVLGILLVQQLGLVGAGIAAMVAAVVDQSLFIRLTCRLLNLELQRIIEQLWRPILGSICMVASVAGARLQVAWTDEPTSHLIWQMLLSAAIGAAIYAATVLLAWLAVGRPNSAEADCAQILHGAHAWVRRRFARRMATR